MNKNILIETQSKLCYYCVDLIDSLAGNPGKWPIVICHENGIPLFYCTKCITMIVNKHNTKLRRIKAMASFANPYNLSNEIRPNKE